MVFSRHGSSELTRIGIIAGRRVGNAVKRNRLKRICRGLVQRASLSFSPGYECILYPKSRILDASFGEINQVWTEMLSQVGILKF